MEKTKISILLRAAHDSEFKKCKDFIIEIRHRGAPGDKKEIDGERILSVQKDGFYYQNELGEEIFIPAHRILKLVEK